MRFQISQRPDAAAVNVTADAATANDQSGNPNQDFQAIALEIYAALRPYPEAHAAVEKTLTNLIQRKNQ